MSVPLDVMVTAGGDPHTVPRSSSVWMSLAVPLVTAAPALLAQAARAALAIIRDDPKRRVHLTGLIEQFRIGAGSLPWLLLPARPRPAALGRGGAVFAP
jgi:hypothetical protein